MKVTRIEFYNRCNVLSTLKRCLYQISRPMILETGWCPTQPVLSDNCPQCLLPSCVLQSDVTPALAPPLVSSCITCTFVKLKSLLSIVTRVTLIQVTTNNECHCLNLGSNKLRQVQVQRTFKLFSEQVSSHHHSHHPTFGNTLPTVRCDELYGWQRI